MEVRFATINDVNSIVSIHIDAFKDFFLTSLGTAFLKFYYANFIKSPETVVMVAEEDGKVIGFSAASINCNGFNKRLIIKNLIGFIAVSLKLFLFSPKKLFRLIKNLTKKSQVVVDDEDYAELYSIGVCKSCQGLGIGRKMLSLTEQELKRKSVERVSLTTDFYNNENTIGFYRSMGYEILYEFITYPNRKMYRLIKSI